MATAVNIGPHQRRRRVILGTAMLMTGVVVALGLITLRVDRWWRVLVFIPFWVAGLGLFQARAKT